MGSGLLSESDVRLVERVRDEFETAWREDGKPRLEDYLRDASEPVRAALLRALLASELESRRQLGERPDPEEYLGRFPADAELIRSSDGREAHGVTLALRPTSAATARDRLISRVRSRALMGTGRSLGKRIWVWPLVGAAVLAVGGIWAYATIERVMRAQVAFELLALRDADLEALHLLFEAHRAIASIAGTEPRVRA